MKERGAPISDAEFEVIHRYLSTYYNRDKPAVAEAPPSAKPAKIEAQAASASLPLTVSDASSIPAAWRGYVAVALQRGFVSLDGNAFNPSRSLTRVELATSLNTLVSQ